MFLLPVGAGNEGGANRKGGQEVSVAQNDGLQLLLEDMTPALARRWNLMTPDAQETLRYAWEDLFAHPEKVAEYGWLSYFHPTRGYIEIHEFRIGYARFVIATGVRLPVLIVDMDLADNDPTYYSAR